MPSSTEDRSTASEPAVNYQRVKFADTRRCAAFLAGLSQFLNRPDSWWHQGEHTAIEVWAHPSQDQTMDLYLSPDALHATIDAFGLPPVVEHDAIKQLPPEAVLVIGRQPVKVWGMNDVQTYLDALLR